MGDLSKDVGRKAVVAEVSRELEGVHSALSVMAGNDCFGLREFSAINCMAVRIAAANGKLGTVFDALFEEGWRDGPVDAAPADASMAQGRDPLNGAYGSELCPFRFACDAMDKEMQWLNREHRYDADVRMELVHMLCEAKGEPLNHENTNRYYGMAQRAVMTQARSQEGGVSRG